MIETLNTALLEMQSAILSRSLYPPAHPQIRAGEERTLEMLTTVLRSRKVVSVFAVEERVIFESKILPGSASLVQGIFQILRRAGINHLTFHEGLTIDDVRDLLDLLASAKGTPGDKLQNLPHISFGVIVPSDKERAIVASPVPAPGCEGAPEELESIWSGISSSQQFEANLLQDIVSTLSRLLVENSRSLVPLAPLKSYDEYTFVHIINVGILSMALSEALGFNKNHTHEIGIAALLHDLGKTAVPLEVLNKSGKFTQEEFRIMQVHPVEGAKLLLRTRGVPSLAPVVAYEHHVRCDGGGYPKVPPGWELNLASRICQVADVYDALRTDRPYRKGLPREKVAEIMQADVGTYFDEDLLDVFLSRVVSGDVRPTHEVGVTTPPVPVSG